ncbi:hypothetical protein V6N13_137163 [Hibiscus sabdariffa]
MSVEKGIGAYSSLRLPKCFFCAVFMTIHGFSFACLVPVFFKSNLPLRLDKVTQDRAAGKLTEGTGRSRSPPEEGARSAPEPRAKTQTQQRQGAVKQQGEQAIRTHHAQFLNFLHGEKLLPQRSLPTTVVSFITRKAPLEASTILRWKIRSQTSLDGRAPACRRENMGFDRLFSLKLNYINSGRIPIRGGLVPENAFPDRSKNSIFGVFDN